MTTNNCWEEERLLALRLEEKIPPATEWLQGKLSAEETCVVLVGNGGFFGYDSPISDEHPYFTQNDVWQRVEQLAGMSFDEMGEHFHAGVVDLALARLVFRYAVMHKLGIKRVNVYPSTTMNGFTGGMLVADDLWKGVESQETTLPAGR